MKYNKKAAFINREDEQNFLLNWLHDEPENVLIIYGPKSSGKTTLLYKFFNAQIKQKKYNIRYFNLREVFISNYKNFIQSFFGIDYSKSKTDVKEKREYNLQVFKLSVDVLKELENNNLDPFDVMKTQLWKIKSSGVQPVIIIDELQALENIYLNGQRELIKELINFFVAVTKFMSRGHCQLRRLFY